jgi:hypothetical protein
MEIPKAIEKNPTYENFEARCPYCKHWNIFNRASDIKSFRLITGQTVVCQNDKCKRDFWIGGDLVNPAWQMLILDCGMLKEQKRYSYCILNLCQAFEMYFALYLRVELLYKPFGIEKDHDIERLNEISRLLFDTINEWTYSRLRKAMMNLIIQNTKYQTLSESEGAIKNLSSFTNEPSDDLIKNISNNKLSETLLELKKDTIHSLRNQVVHKNGYCPTLEEVEKAEEDTRILYKLDHCLGVLSQKSYIYETIL